LFLLYFHYLLGYARAGIKLLERGVLKKSEASGRRTSYELMPVRSFRAA